ncbi:MAG: hypothetical protein GY757_09235 [bacterium]|nr:hypothetical protein [bacterium]
MQNEVLTIGKKIGRAAFVIVEVMICCTFLLIIANAFFKEGRLQFGVKELIEIVGLQIGVFVTTWTAKAASNWAKKKTEVENG